MAVNFAEEKCMSEIKSIIAKNIASLRTSAGLTQLELAEKLNYSDKAVSKWERGESTPDVAVLTHIADLFGVPLDYLVREDHEGMPTPEFEVDEKKKTERIMKTKLLRRRNRGFITGMCLILVWLLATTVFMILDASLGEGVRGHYLVFAYAVPATMIVWLVFNSVWFNTRRNFLIISLLMWTVLLCIHMTLYSFGFNLWMIFILGVPGQIIIVLWSMIKYKSDTDDEEEEAVIHIDEQ